LAVVKDSTAKGNLSMVVKQLGIVGVLFPHKLIEEAESFDLVTVTIALILLCVEQTLHCTVRS
jgi:hypothetical protein